MNKILILGFYGVGKTTMLKDYPNAIDLTDVLKLENIASPSLDVLMKYWKDERYDIVMADPEWTSIFIQSGIPFYVVIPKSSRKDEFFINFRKRYKIGSGGGDIKFCNYVWRCWDGWLEFYRHKLPCKKLIELDKGQWIKDVIDYIKLEEEDSREENEIP